MNEEMGAVAAEALPFIQTTSVDGRIYASTEDILEIVHASMDALSESFMKAVEVYGGDAEYLFMIEQRAEGMAASLSMFDTLFHAVEDREGIESLSPGDFL